MVGGGAEDGCQGTFIDVYGDRVMIAFHVSVESCSSISRVGIAGFDIISIAAWSPRICATFEGIVTA